MVINGTPRKIFESGLTETVAGAMSVLDVGTSQRFAKELRPYEEWFKDRRYVAAGYKPLKIYGAYNCDCHQDIEAMSFRDEEFDAVLCIEVLEHVKNPARAAAEIFRVLRPGGRAMVTTPFLYGYHGKGSQSHSHETYPDFWRFTHEGLGVLFAQFEQLRVKAVHGPLETRLLGFKLFPLINTWWGRRLLDRFDRPSITRATTRYLATMQRPLKPATNGESSTTIF